MPVVMTAPDAKPIVTKEEGELERRRANLEVLNPAMASKSGKDDELISIKHPLGSERQEETPKKTYTATAVDKEKRTMYMTRMEPEDNSAKEPLDDTVDHDDGSHGDNDVGDGDDNNNDRGDDVDEEEKEKEKEEDEEEEEEEEQEEEDSKIGDQKFDGGDAAAADDHEAKQRASTEAKRVPDNIESEVDSDTEVDTNVEPDSFVFSQGDGYASPSSSNDTSCAGYYTGAIASFPCYPNGAECQLSGKITDDGEYSMNSSNQQRIPAARRISERWNLFLFQGNEFFQRVMDSVTELEQVIEYKALENKDLHRQVARLKEENLELKKVKMGKLEDDKRELQNRLTIAVAKMNEYRQMYEQQREKNLQSADDPRSLHSSDSANNEHSSREQEGPVTLAVDRGLASIEEETMKPQELPRDDSESSVERRDSQDDDDDEVTLRADKL